MQITKRAKYIYRTEGLIPVIKRAFSFLTGFVYRNESFYIIDYSQGKGLEKDIRPALMDYTFKRIEKNDISVGDPLAMYVYNKVADAGQRLNSGAVAFCVFYGNDLAAIGWVALTVEAHRSLFQPGYKVDFPSGEASTAGGWTSPRYRGMRLGTYIYFKRLEYIWSKGKKGVQTAVRVDNTASLKMHANFSPIVRAKGRDLKVLWYKSWSETPMNLEISKVIK